MSASGIEARWQLACTAPSREFGCPSTPLEFGLVNLRVQRRSDSLSSTLRQAVEVIDWSGALCCSMALRTMAARQLCKRGVDVDAREDSMDAVRAYVEYGRNLRSEEHTSELQSLRHLVCRLLLEKKK